MRLRLGAKEVVAATIVIGVTIAGFYVILSSQTRAYVGSTPAKFTVNGRTYGFTYVATNEADQEAGLMNKKITNTTFMLFVFSQSEVYPFWMYHVNSSLDIIWIDVTGTSGRVVYIASDVPGCPGPICPNYTPSSIANYVIEAQGGFSSANGMGVGTTITFG